MAHAPGFQGSAPMAEMNLTPLIDVMLVLLVMFIITIPLQTHSVKLDLPQDGPIAALPDPVRNKVVVTGEGQLLWNAAPVTLDGLRHSLALAQQMYPLAELHLQPEPDARYGLVDEVLAATKQARVERMGFVGNERYATF